MAKSDRRIGYNGHMSKPYVTILGKLIRQLARLRGGSGSALPGLIIERIDPHFMERTLAPLPHGIVIISGTNGKTTTAKMVVELLEGQGLTVFTNRTGSNFTRGIVAALLADVDLRGRLQADIAVLELDEAHAVPFIAAVKPRYSLILNVLRDQLDRFGEIDYTTNLLRQVVEATTDTIVLNREDKRIADLAKVATAQQVVYFGLASSLLSTFPSDDELRGEPAEARAHVKADVTLEAFSHATAQFRLGTTEVSTQLQLTGIYNVYNAAAALALVRTIIGPTLDESKLLTTLSQITPAFGRGESFHVEGHPLELVLVKNPSGFRLGLQSFDPKKYATMIAINDNYADGRDMSWLWDVNFASLGAYGVAQVSGLRAYDMALRLQYDEVPIESVESDLNEALAAFIADHPDQPKRIYCTYTAMLALRRQLGKYTHVEAIG